QQDDTGGARPMLAVLFGAVLAVLLVACANVANVVMARGAAREREVAIRGALGAGRSRVVRQMLTESLVLGLGGAAAGLAVAYGAVRGFVALLPKSLARLRQIDPGFRPDQVISVEVPLPSFPRDTAARGRDFYDAILSRVQALPPVRAAAVATALPFGALHGGAAIDIEAHPT